uniref:Predicted protein n=1 Tax=Hordeum vulgare subsp. vulgare TaxID=112509 RepID=F2EED2_HORVV|nr:predicted protein [Hordeum vulgare subsp. vulgare]
MADSKFGFATGIVVAVVASSFGRVCDYECMTGGSDLLLQGQDLGGQVDPRWRGDRDSSWWHPWVLLAS